MAHSGNEIQYIVWMTAEAADDDWTDRMVLVCVADVVHY